MDARQLRNNDKDKGDPLELNWAYMEAILNWAMKTMAM